MSALLNEILRCTTRERTIGRRNRAISSLTIVDTAVNSPIALRSLFRLIGSGIDKPLDRRISEMPNKTVSSTLVIRRRLTYRESHEIWYRPAGVVGDMEAR